MGVFCKKGTFTKNTGTGTQDITTVGFQPKALILWTSNQTVETFEEHAHVSYGFSDGTNDCVTVHRVEDNSTTSDNDSNLYNDAIVQIINASTSGAEEARATLNAWLSNGFQLNWSVNTTPAAVIHYMAIGGDSITNVKVGTQSVGTTTTGNKSYTGVGFQPDFLLTINSGALPGAGSYTYNTTIETHAGLGISAMKSTSARWCMSTASEDAQPTSDTWRYHSITKCFSYVDNTTGTLLLAADFVSFDSDGFTWNYGTNTTANNQNAPFAYLAIKGGVWDVGSFLSPTTNTTVVTNTDSSAKLRGIMTHETQNGAASLDAVQTHSIIDIGGSDGTNQGMVTYCDLDGQGNMITARKQNDDNLVYHMVSAATATSSTTPGNCTVTFSTNSFTTSWSNTDGSQRYISYWGVSGHTEVTDTNTFIFNILQEVTDTNTFLFNIIAETTKTNTFLFNILQELTDTNTFLFNILQEVTDTNTFLFNIIAETVKTNTFLFDIIAEVVDTNTFLFNILQEVEDINTFLFDIESAFVIKDNTFLFDIIAETTKTNTFLYDILQEVTDTNTFLFNILNEIDPKTNTFIFDILSETTKTNTFLFDIIAETTKTNTFLYNILNEITPKSNTFLFNILQEVTDTNTFIFNIIAETTKSLTLRFDIEAFIEVIKTLTSIFNINPSIAEFITDPGYSNPLTFRITFKSKKGDTVADESGDQIVYYQYDPYDFDNRPFNITQFSIRLTQGEISTANLTIEDHQGLITDPNKIGKKAVVEVDFKKEAGRDWQRILTGYVRNLKRLRPAYRALSYQIVIKSKQIIYNERIVDFKRAAKKAVIDSTDAVVTDSRMLANNLFRELHTATDIFPRKNSPTLQQTGDFDLETGSISEEVKDFFTEIAPGLTTAAEVANQLAEGSGAIWGVDEFGNPYLRYPTEKHSGIIIKDNPENTDSALNTSVNLSSFEFEDTIDLSEGHANRLYVLNSKDTKVQASSNKASGFTSLTNRWIAQSFIAIEPNITSAAFILSKTGNPTNATGTIKGVLRSDGDTGFPNSPSPLATFEISLSQLTNAKDTIFVNDIKTKEGAITIGQRYWWILQGTGLFDNSNTVNWHHDNDFVTTTGRLRSGRLPLADADPTTPGTKLLWQVSDNGPVYSFSTFSSINHILVQSDPESIAENGLIETIVNLPAFDTDADYQKVLVKLIRDSAKEKRIFDLTKISIPTALLFRPGELVTIIDSKANLDAEKQINAEIVEVTYNFDTNTNAMGCRYVDLRLIGFIDPITDNYLENREC